MSFQNAQNVDASHSTFNDVHGTQVNNIIVSNAAVLQLTGKVTNYLKAVHDAPMERFDLLGDVCALEALLNLLRIRVEGANSGDPWLSALQDLRVKDGPFDQLRSDLERIVSKLGPVNGTLTWNFDEMEIKDILSKIERMKTYVNLALTNDLFTLSQAMKADVLETKKEIAVLRSSQNDQERMTIAGWLSSLSFKAIQNDIFQKRENGTGEWLLEHTDFKEWRDGKSESNTLFCSGIPGAGKTVLASTVADHLQRLFGGDNVAIALIYCNYKDQVEQTAPKLVAALLKQIVQDHSAISNNVRSLYRCHIDKNTRPMLTELRDALRLELATYTKAFIIIDALDECSEDGGTRELLLQSLPSTVALMVTSRNLPSIARLFQEAKHLNICANNQDVQKYIEGRIPRERRLARYVAADPELQQSIVKKIVGNVGGMFLLARLHMDSLVSKTNCREVRKALERLPKEVNDTYDEAMKRIEAQTEDDRELAKRALSWIAYAYRPLSLEELQHALAVEPEMTDMDFDAIVDAEVLTSVCAGLIVLQNSFWNKRVTNVRLVHYTAQVYFELNRDSQFPGAQASITVACLTYLSFNVLESHRDIWKALHDYALVDYASRHWGNHARGPVEETCKKTILEFLRDNSKVASAGDPLLWNGVSSFFGRLNGYSAVHIASVFGLAQIVKHQLEDGAVPDSKDSMSRTPLSWAAANGHDAVVKVLLACDGIEVNSRDETSRTPLLLATENGHDAVVKLLLTRDDIDVNSKDKTGRRPLFLAAYNGHDAVVKLLLARDDVEVNSKGETSQTPLLWAARHGRDIVVKLLLTRDNVDVNSKDETSRTPLLLATENGHDTVVKLLLTRDDIDVNSKDKTGRTPLLLASENGHDAAVKLLLAQDDVEVNSKDEENRTPLSCAARRGHNAIVNLLLTRDNIEVNSKDETSRTPLLLAAENGHDAVVKLLLAQDDVEVNSKDEENRTPLLCAARRGRDAMVKLLLTRDNIEVNCKDETNRTPLSFAAENGHDTVVKLLLAQDDIEVNSKDKESLTPLSWAAANGHDAVVKRLLTRDDIAVNSKDGSGGTPLLLAAENGHDAVVKLLLACDGIEVNSNDKWTRTPLSWAAENRHDAVVKLLLMRDDIEINSKNEENRTPLSWAAENGHEAVVKLLLARGDVEVNSKDKRGRTPLSFAAENGHDAVMKLLLARDDVGINSKDRCSWTPLSWAAANGHDMVVKLLLEQDADMNLKDSWDRTPLSWAAYNGYDIVVKLLLTRDNVEVNSKDKMSQTPLSWAAKNGHDPVMKLLLAQDDVDVNSKDKMTLTPLSWAAAHGNNTVVELLLARDDVEVNSMDEDNRTPLLWAAIYGRDTVVKLLLARGDVNVNSKDTWNLTPLSWAAAHGHNAVVKLLLARDDVEVDSKDKEGMTPLLRAVKNGHDATVMLLQSRLHSSSVCLKRRASQTPPSSTHNRGKRQRRSPSH